MVSNIVWSPKAKKTYFDIINYLVENWTPKEVQNFITRTQIVLNHIDQNYCSIPTQKKVMFTRQ